MIVILKLTCDRRIFWCHGIGSHGLRFAGSGDDPRCHEICSPWTLLNGHLVHCPNCHEMFCHGLSDDATFFLCEQCVRKLILIDAHGGL